MARIRARRGQPRTAEPSMQRPDRTPSPGADRDRRQHSPWTAPRDRKRTKGGPDPSLPRLEESSSSSSEGAQAPAGSLAPWPRLAPDLLAWPSKASCTGRRAFGAVTARGAAARVPAVGHQLCRLTSALGTGDENMDPGTAPQLGLSLSLDCSTSLHPAVWGPAGCAAAASAQVAPGEQLQPAAFRQAQGVGGAAPQGATDCSLQPLSRALHRPAPAPGHPLTQAKRAAEQQQQQQVLPRMEAAPRALQAGLTDLWVCRWQLQQKLAGLVRCCRSWSAPAADLTRPASFPACSPPACSGLVAVCPGPAETAAWVLARACAHAEGSCWGSLGTDPLHDGTADGASLQERRP